MPQIDRPIALCAARNGKERIGVERAKKIPARAEPSQYPLSKILARAEPSQSRLTKIFGSSQNEPQKVQLEPKRANIFFRKLADTS